MGRPKEVARPTGVQSIDRAARLLRCFGPNAPERGVSELARETGMSVSTTHRLLSALAGNGLLRPTGGGRYTLGPLISQLARSGMSTHLREVAPPIMAKLRDEVEETVGLHELLATDERAVVDQAESHQPLHRRYTEIGVPIPLPYGAPGKAILAFLPAERREAVLARPLHPITPATITDPERLRRELGQAHRRGCAFSYAERTPGIHTVAAPIFDHTNAVVGSLSVSGPEQRMSRARTRALVEPVQDAAWAVSRMLGTPRERDLPKI
ncbi:MAG: helix-turn-helix domain-containing protein [Streptosporangiales bacterium]|nr:helix-turn-helix domain-containing protein [Streptosporangiales bacterium]